MRFRKTMRNNWFHTTVLKSFRACSVDLFSAILLSPAFAADLPDYSKEAFVIEQRPPKSASRKMARAVCLRSYRLELLYAKDAKER